LHSQRALSEEKTFSAELQISAVISRYPIEDRCDSNPVGVPTPSLACNIAANRGVPVHLGVCEDSLRLMHERLRAVLFFVFVANGSSKPAPRPSFARRNPATRR
jgi:hypothetical protein